MSVEKLERFRQVLCRAALTVGCEPVASEVNREQATVEFGSEEEAELFFELCAASKVGKMQAVSDRQVLIVLRLDANC